MPLDPQVEYVLGLVAKSPYPEFHAVLPEEARDIFEQTAPALNIRPENVYRSEDLLIDGIDGDIPIRIYTPHAPA
ncbi:MAG: alpha/beta hydrolase, partial [Alphaproteobacteria bacterium]